MEALIARLAQELGARPEYVEHVVQLLDEGNTIPFIARYRKELHGAMDDGTLRTLESRLAYLRNLEQRRQEIQRAVENQGKMTPALQKALEQALTLAELEDLYRPYKQKRRTRATAAREKGLEPLAQTIFAQRMDLAPLTQLAQAYVKEGGAESAEQALQGAADILAEQISDDAKIRSQLRGWMQSRASLAAAASDPEQDSVYRHYYGFSQRLDRLQSHQILALNRAEKEGILKVQLQADRAALLQLVRRAVVVPGSPAMEFVKAAAEDSYDRLIAPSMEREIRALLTQRANEGAIHNFALNLRPLLMQPPVRGAVTMGLDPGYQHGCKVAVVDATGKVLETAVVYPTKGEKRRQEAISVLRRLIERYGVRNLAIGNGTASRETEAMAAELIADMPGVQYLIVSEAGASVYSVSALAAEEFPQFDVNLRSAVSIARRLQDPLAELVKIDPKAIGVGQYQHDVPEKQLDAALDAVVEDCVNAVGVDVNTTSAPLLQRVSGLSAAVARNIVAYREQNGPFMARSALRKVPKLGPKAYEQCAGFLRVPESAEIFDHTGIHPESYAAAEQLLKLCGYSKQDVAEGSLQALPERLQAHRDSAEAVCGAGFLTLQDIAQELMKPGRDPRDTLPAPQLRSDVLRIEDLRPGMQLQGTVRNVIDFGVFVDLGVHQDGLVHISQVCDRYIRHPSEVVSVGDVVQVTVLDVDAAKKRISLSMKQAAEQKRQ